MSLNPKPIDWHFPLSRPHTGVPLGDGTLGLLVWGETALHLTVARAGFWDRRGGSPALDHVTYADVRGRLEADDMPGMRALFAETEMVPQQIGGGRLVLTMPDGAAPVRGQLDLATGVLTVTFANDATVTVRVLRGEESVWLESNTDFRAELIPAYDLVRAQAMAKRGIAEPARWTDGQTGGGFTQTLPQDEPLAVAFRRDGNRLAISTALGDDADAVARTRVSNILAQVLTSDDWLTAYWQTIPSLELPDADLQFAYELGCWKQAGLTPPDAPAATLQGAWMEDNQLPPWSNDYHFNINVQLVYGPVYATNRLAHLDPLWALVKGWLPIMRRYGEHFFGRPGALMLPHSVDDQCQVIGGCFHTTIDHACMAWVGEMAWQHYRYSMDLDVVRDLAWPLYVGAFEGFWAMLVPVERDGRRELSLPFSVSPEYTDGTMSGTCGRDASFQFSALRMTADRLIQAAALLGEPVDSRWAEVLTSVPHYTTVPGSEPDRPRIALWEGLEIQMSHRHHAHLAAIWPFQTIDPFAPEHRTIVADSIRYWCELGSGQWTGWCIPWAAQICTRCNQADAAMLWLKWWSYLFVNEGYGTLHNADFPGITAWDDGALYRPDFEKEPDYSWEMMQSDAGMAAVQAILDLLVHARGETLHVLPRLPKGWRELAFDGVRTEGAFLIGATVRNRRVLEIRVTSLAGAPLNLALPDTGPWWADGERIEGTQVDRPTSLGQSLRFTRA